MGGSGVARMLSNVRVKDDSNLFEQMHSQKKPVTFDDHGNPILQ